MIDTTTSMIEKIREGDHHGFGQPPPKTTSHNQRITVHKQLPCDWFLEKFWMSHRKFMKLLIHGGKLLPHFIYQIHSNIRIFQFSNIIIRPLHYCWCFAHHLQIGVKKWNFAQHFLPYEVERQYIKFRLFSVRVTKGFIRAQYGP